MEAIEFKDESAEILSGLEADIDWLIFILILLLTMSSCVCVCKFIPSGGEWLYIGTSAM